MAASRPAAVLRPSSRETTWLAPMESPEARRSRTRKWRSMHAQKPDGRRLPNTTPPTPKEKRISTRFMPRPESSIGSFEFLEHGMTQSAAASDDNAWNGRVEDDALLRGQGLFGDDVKPDGTLAAYFVRSPHAFARIVRIDVAAAKSAPGVVAALTAADLSDAHYHSISHGHPIPGRGGKTAISPHRPSLAETRVMHVGE